MKNSFVSKKHASLSCMMLCFLLQIGSICFSQSPELLHRKIDSLKTYSQDLEHKLDVLEKIIDDVLWHQRVGDVAHIDKVFMTGPALAKEKQINLFLN